MSSELILFISLLYVIGIFGYVGIVSAINMASAISAAFVWPASLIVHFATAIGKIISKTVDLYFIENRIGISLIKFKEKDEIRSLHIDDLFRRINALEGTVEGLNIILKTHLTKRKQK